MTATAVRRRVKGERRRKALLEAALTLIGRGGPAALTHRALAAEAGVPPATTTYYFTSKDELLREALQLAVDQDSQLAEDDPSWAAAVAATDAGGLARGLADNLSASLRDRERALAHHEVFLAAAREPALGGAAAEWTAADAAALEPLLAGLGSPTPEVDARAVTALLDGLSLEQLAGPRPAHTRAVLERVLDALLPDTAGDTA